MRIDFESWRIHLKLRWEYFLVHTGLKTQEQFADDVLAYFKKKGWSYGGSFHGSLKDVMQEVKSEYENLRKIREYE